MPRSTTIWAAALVLASLSGSGSILTTADALPAPGPQETAMRPKYYFPRHVKRIVTNSTAPAPSTTTTSSTSSSTSTSDLETRQSSGDRSSFSESFWHLSSLFSSSSSSSSSSADGVTSTTRDVDRPAPPLLSEISPTGTGNVIFDPTFTTSTTTSETTSTTSSTSTTETSEKPSSGGVPSDEVLPTVEVPLPTTSTSTSSRSTSIVGPFIIPGSTDGVPTTVLTPTTSLSTTTSTTSAENEVEPTSTSTTGIVVGITTALGTSTTSDATTSTTSDATTSTTSDATTSTTSDTVVIPTSDTTTGGLLSSILSGVTSVVSDVTSALLPTSTSVTGITDVVPGPTAPTTTTTEVPPTTSEEPSVPTTTTTPILPIPDPSSIISSISSELSSIFSPPGTGPIDSPTTVIPTTTAIPTSDTLSLPLTSDLSLTLPTVTLPTVTLPTDSPLPTPTISVPTDNTILPTPTISPTVPTDVTIPLPTPTDPGSVTSPTSTPTDGTISIPTSEPSPTTSPTTTGDYSTTDAGITPTSPAGTGVSSTTTSESSTDISVPASEPPSSTSTSSTTDSGVTSGIGNNTSIATPTGGSSSTTDPTLTFTPPTATPTHSILPTATDTDTTYNVGTSINFVPSTASTSTVTSVPTELAAWIQPPEGMPTVVPADTFRGQIGFKYGLHWEYVVKNDGGNQIFTYMRIAIADALQIKSNDVINFGLAPDDTWSQKGWGTTKYIFGIPSALQDPLRTQVGQPSSEFYNNANETVRQLTNLVDNTFYGSFSANKPSANGNNAAAGPSSTGPAGGVDGNDMKGSKPVNATSAGIAAGAVLGAIAYGSAMFFVARRYRQRKLAHRRSSSVPSTNRYTYGSMGAAWMSGARNGRMTPGLPGSRGSHGSSSSSNGRSVRTQQISAPVMAENSLGWN